MKAHVFRQEHGGQGLVPVGERGGMIADMACPFRFNLRTCRSFCLQFVKLVFGSFITAPRGRWLRTAAVVSALTAKEPLAALAATSQLAVDFAQPLIGGLNLL